MKVVKRYNIISDTIKAFHESQAPIRCIVGSVGSGKTTAATMEICLFLPQLLFEQLGWKETRWVVVRNTYRELHDTTFKTIRDWFPHGKYLRQEDTYKIVRKDNSGRTLWSVELLLRSCDNSQDMKKFKSLEVTGYWCDESVEINEEVKNMLKNRIGRFPQRGIRFGIETTNPPDIEHPLFHTFKWMGHLPVHPSSKPPLEDHVGFWQAPRENEANLPDKYYDNLMNSYRDYPEWVDTYVNCMPVFIPQGKAVYNHFSSGVHIADKELTYDGSTLLRGWDNSGNIPACVVCQRTQDDGLHVLKEFCGTVENIITFTKRVVSDCAYYFPGARYIDVGDPAGANKYSDAGGGFTSNAELMFKECGIKVIPSEQNLTARLTSVEKLLRQRGGLLISPSCVRLIGGFQGGYCFAEINGIVKDKPEKNKYSHIHDALSYVAVYLTKSGSLNLKPFKPVRRSL